MCASCGLWLHICVHYAGSGASFTRAQPWTSPFLPSPGFRMDPWQRGVLPFHSYLHGLKYTAHTRATERARGVSDHCKGGFTLGADVCSVAYTYGRVFQNNLAHKVILKKNHAHNSQKKKKKKSVKHLIQNWRNRGTPVARHTLV